jgi:hypothetical protein
LKRAFSAAVLVCAAGGTMCTVPNPDFDPRFASDGLLVPIAPSEAGPPSAPPADGAGAGREQGAAPVPPQPPPLEKKPLGVDLLVVVDNSSGMKLAQQWLSSALGTLTASLEKLPGGLRVGAITTDLGVGPGNTTPSCSESGDGAKLKVPASCGMFPPGTSFLEVAGGKANASGSVGDAAACLALQGEGGCGFVQPLEALRRALSGSSGLPRSDAALAVVILTSDDDCSSTSSSLYAWDDFSLGPYANYRCFQHGVLCGGKKPPLASGSLSSCAPGGTLLHPVTSRYADFVRTLRPAGWASALVLAAPALEPYQVSAGWDSWGMKYYKLKPTCQAAGDSLAARPALRLAAFSAALGASGLQASVCEPYAAALAQLAATIKKAF